MIQKLFRPTQFYILAICLLTGCTKKNEATSEYQNSTKFIPEKTNVRTFEVVKITTEADLAEKYDAVLQAAGEPTKVNTAGAGTITFTVNLQPLIPPMDGINSSVCAAMGVPLAVSLIFWTPVVVNEPVAANL